MLRWKSILRPSTDQPILDSDVLLYVPFTDANGSTRADGYVLSGGTHTLTADVFTREGTAVVNTDQSKMDDATTSAYGPGGSNVDGWHLDSTISSGLEVGSSSPLSIQFWFYCSNAASNGDARLLSWGGYHSSGTGFEIESNGSDYDSFIFYEFTGSGTARRSLGTYQLTANAWNHIYWAFQPSGGSYVGIDGTVTSIANAYINNFAPTVDLHLLKTPSAADDAVEGYVQELIIRDTVPYTSNFTPTTVPLASITSPPSSGTNPGTTNLVGNWSMDEASGTRVDSHGSNDLTDNNTVGSATGIISNAASFVSANSEYLSSTTVPVTGTGARSMEVWFKTSTTGTMHIAGFGGSNSGTNGAAFRLSIESGSLFCRVYGGYAEFGGSWNDGAWHQVVLKIMDSGFVRDLEMYVDGSSQTRVAAANLDFTTINTGTDEFSVGKNIQATTTNYFNGDIDILRIFNDELTADEITWLYNSGIGRSYSDVSGGTTYVYEEDFEAAGTPSGFTNTIVGSGTIDYDYTTDPGSGLESLEVVTSGGDSFAELDLGAIYDNFELIFQNKRIGGGSNRTWIVLSDDSNYTSPDHIVIGNVSGWDYGFNHNFNPVTRTSTGVSTTAWHWAKLFVDIPNTTITLTISASSDFSSADVATTTSQTFGSSFGGVRYARFGGRNRDMTVLVDSITFEDLS